MYSLPAGPLSRRSFLAQALGVAAASAFARPALGQTGQRIEPVDATFLFIADVHACRMASGLSPNCQQEGKTDAALLRNVAALNGIGDKDWPAEIDGVATGLRSAGSRIGTPLGLVVGGDITDDGGGQITQPSEGTQLLQFSQRYQQGIGPDRVHMPVYVGLGNHDLDQNGPPHHVDWYRREMRDYVEVNHRPGVFFKPPVPATELRCRHRLLFLGLGRPASCPDAPFRRRYGPRRHLQPAMAEAGSGDLCRRRPPGHPVPALWLGYFFDREMGSAKGPSTMRAPARRTGGASVTARRCFRR